MAVSLNPVISDYLNAEYKFRLILEAVRKNFENIPGFDIDMEVEISTVSSYQN